MIELAIYISNIKQLIWLNELEVLNDNEMNFDCFDGDISILKELDSIKLKRIYFGNEFCENLIPSIDEIRKIRKIVRKKNLSLTLVTPTVTDKGMKKLKDIFSYLDNFKEKLEVSINDYGVLHLINNDYKKFTCILGRKINKLKRMPRYAKKWSNLPPLYEKSLDKIFNKENADVNLYSIKNILNLTDKQVEALRKCSTEVEIYKKFLTEIGINRIELDLIPQGIDMDFTKTNIRATLYYPWSYITTGRVCEMGSMHLPITEKFKPGGKCNKECQKYYAKWKSDYPYISQNLVSAGNTVFMKAELSNQMLEFYYKRGFNRIVYEPILPM